MVRKFEHKTFDAGVTFGRYTIVRLLGTGGMGAVYEATHNDLKKRVALKTLHPQYSDHGEIQARFLREGESASRIRHPHVVDVTDFGVHEGMAFLVMEFLEGESLAQLLVRQGPLAVETLADLLLPVCAGVSAAHDEKVIHRDLKPDNLFLARGRKGELVPKVVDFGISKLSDEQQPSALTNTNAMLGTPHYMSPEQMRTSRNIDARVDQYALGVILYECATGEKPFEAETLYELMHKIATGEFVRPRERCAELPADLEAAIVRAMAREAGERFGSVRALGAALLPFATARARAVWTAEFVDAAEPAPLADRTAGRPVAAVSASAADRMVRKASAAPALGGSTLANTGLELDSRAQSGRWRAGASARGRLVGAAAFAVAILGGGYAVLRGQTPTATPVPPTPRTVVAAASAPPSRFHAMVRVEPAAAVLELDGEASGTGVLDHWFARDGASHTLVVRAPGFTPRIVTFRDEPPPAALELAPSSALSSAPSTPAAIRAAIAGPIARPPEPARARRPNAPAVARGAHPAVATPAAVPTAAPAAGPAVGANGAAIIN